MNRPTIRELVQAVRLVASVVGAESASYCFGGRFAIQLGAGWSLLVSADDAGRFRLEACYSGRIRATMWVFADNPDRLAELAEAATDEAAALVA